MADSEEDDRKDTRWLSYDELTRVRGIDRESAIRLVRRKQWAKRAGNDGSIRVAIPQDVLLDAQTGRPGTCCRTLSRTYRGTCPL